MQFKKVFIAAVVLGAVELMALSQVKVICDKDGEEIYLDGKFKTECDKDEVVRLMVKAGRHDIEVKKRDKEARYGYSKKFKIGDGVQKVVEPQVKPVYNEYHYYKSALENESLASCREYMQKYPKGQYLKKIKELQAYLEAKQEFSKYAPFKRRYPKSPYLQKLKAHYLNNPLITTLKGHTKAVETIVMNKDATRLFSGGDDERIVEWDLNTNKQIKTFTYSHKRGGTLTVSTLALSPDEKFLYSDGRSAFRKWNIQTGKGEVIAEYWPEKILLLDKHHAVTCRGDRVDIWNLPSEKTTYTYLPNDGYDANLYGCTLSQDKSFLYFGLYDDKAEEYAIVKLDLKNKKIANRYSDAKLQDKVRSIALTPDGRYILSGTDGGESLVWDAKNGRVVKILKQKGIILAAATDEKKEIVATGSSDGSVKIWDDKTWMLIKELPTYVSVNDLKFSQDGLKLAGALDSGDIDIWYSGFFDKSAAMDALLDKCQNGDVPACNDYIVNGGKKKAAAKQALLKELRSIVRANGSDIEYKDPKIYLYTHKNIDTLDAQNAHTLYTVETIVKNGKQIYVLVDMNFNNTGFTFNAPIRLIQNDKKQNYSQKVPEDYKIKIGTQDVKVVFVYDDFGLSEGKYQIIEGDGCANCLKLRDGEIVEIY